MQNRRLLCSASTTLTYSGFPSHMICNNTASYPDVSPSMKMCAQGKETTGETSLRLPSVPFPWFLAVHHQSLAFRARLYHAKKTKRLRRTLVIICVSHTNGITGHLKFTASFNSHEYARFLCRHTPHWLLRLAHVVGKRESTLRLSATLTFSICFPYKISSGAIVCSKINWKQYLRKILWGGQVKLRGTWKSQIS